MRVDHDILSAAIVKYNSKQNTINTVEQYLYVIHSNICYCHSCVTSTRSSQKVNCRYINKKEVKTAFFIIIMKLN